MMVGDIARSQAKDRIVTSPSPLSKITPPGTAATFGPWKMTLTEAITGNDAAAKIKATNDANPDPGSGLAYLLVHITATNTSKTPRILTTADFSAGVEGDLFRPVPSVVTPQPELEVTVAPGKTVDGWVALETLTDNAGGDGVVVRYNSTTITGDWSDALFAVTGAPTLSAKGGTATADTQTGASPQSPAAMNQPVRVGDWEVTVLATAGGQQVFNMSDYRLQALGDSDSAGTEVGNWLGVQVKVTNLSDRTSFLSPTAVEMANADGSWIDTAVSPAELAGLNLTAPAPDASGEYLPGTTRDGWFVLRTAGPVPLIRIQPTYLIDDKRFVTLDGNAAPAAVPTGQSASSGALNVQTGATVTVTDDGVNMRDAPATSGKVVATLPKGERLEITGDPQTADGYRWYPVKDVKTGKTGYIVQDFLAPA